MQELLVDMHSHTTCSDGDVSPEEIILNAAKLGIQLFSITDHDNLDSYDHVVNMYEDHQFPDGIVYIPAVELFSMSEADGSDQHLAVYFPHLSISNHWPVTLRAGGKLIRIQRPYKTSNQIDEFYQLRKYLEELKTARVYRNIQMIENLNKYYNLGLSTSEFCEMFEIDQESHKCLNTIGRPHIARYLMSKGIVGSVKEAFATYISNDSPAVIPTKFKSIETFCQIFSDHGAVCILCHPNQRLHDTERIKVVVASGLAHGLAAIEKYHPQCDYKQLEFFDGTVSIASDYHGIAKPGNLLGNLAMNAIMTPEEKIKLVSLLFGRLVTITDPAAKEEEEPLAEQELGVFQTPPSGCESTTDVYQSE